MYWKDWPDGIAVADRMYEMHSAGEALGIFHGNGRQNLWDSKQLVEEVLAAPAAYPELLEQRCTREPYADALRAHVTESARVCSDY